MINVRLWKLNTSREMRKLATKYLRVSRIRVSPECFAALQRHVSELVMDVLGRENDSPSATIHLKGISVIADATLSDAATLIDTENTIPFNRSLAVEDERDEVMPDVIAEARR